VGSNTFGTNNLWDTQIESAAAYAGIGGTRTDSPNFANQAVGTTSFDDDEGNTWTINQTVPADTNTHDDPDTAETWTFNIDATGELEWTYNSDRIGTELTLVDNFFNLGVFSLAEVATTHTEAGVEYQASLRDYAWQLNRKMGEHITVADGTNAGSMIESLIIGALPEIQFVADTTIYTLPTMAIEEDENRLDVIEQIAQSVGFEIWFDREGRCNIRSADAVVGNSLWTYGEGGFAAQNITRRFVDNGEIINGVVVDGEDLEDGLVVEGEFWDLDTSSPTYYDPLTNAGTVGPRPDTLRNELIDTTQRANYAAFSHLIKVGTGPEYVDFECAPNPAMKLRDLIDLCDTAMGIDGQWEVVALSVPVGLGLQQVTARRQWDPSGGDAVVQA
jgi:hypothetical protein